MIIEEFSIINDRCNYLRKIKSFREAGYDIVCMDETWVNQNHYTDYMWLPNDGSQGPIQNFKIGGAHLKKMRRAEGGAKNVGVFRVKNHDFTPKNHIFSNFRGGTPAPGSDAPKIPLGKGKRLIVLHAVTRSEGLTDQGRIQDFKLGGVHLKKLRRAEGGAKIFGVFLVKNHSFTPKNHFFQLRKEARKFLGYFV